MAAGPPSPAAGSAEPVSSRALAAHALPCGVHYLLAEPAGGCGGGARPGEGRTGPRRGRRGWWGCGVAELSRGPTRGHVGKGGALEVRSLRTGRSSSVPPGIATGAWPRRGSEGRFYEWKGLEVGLLGDTRESRALRGGSGGTMPGTGNSLAGGHRSARRSQPRRAPPRGWPEPTRVETGASHPAGCSALPFLHPGLGSPVRV